MTVDELLQILNRACRSELTAIRSVTKLQPAGGSGDKIFPPTYEGGAYAFEKRIMSPQIADTVLRDSVQSQANRFEEALLEAFRCGRVVLPVFEMSVPGPLETLISTPWLRESRYNVIMLVDLRPPLIPPGSHIISKTKCGHEMIARGRAADGTELVSTTEPGAPRHFVTLTEASKRYRFCAITPPLSREHAAKVIDRDNALIESEQFWELGKNCQHEARFAYTGKPDSPTLESLIKVLTVGGLVCAGIKLFNDN